MSETLLNCINSEPTYSFIGNLNETKTIDKDQDYLLNQIKAPVKDSNGSSENCESIKERDNESILTDQQIKMFGKILIDQSEPLKKRFRALFTLKNLQLPESLPWIRQALIEDNSVLLKHECGYCMGQMALKEAVPLLIPILEDTNEDPITRHECAEALGNLATFCNQEMKANVTKVLEKQLQDSSILVAQTCQLSLDKINWQESASEEEKKAVNCDKFSTYDPAPPMVNYKSKAELESILKSNETSLHNKYRALFTLRNLSDPESVAILGRTLVYYKNDRTMDLMMHEIGYIFGQLCDPDSIDYLTEIISCKDCHEIARHECTEALGSIATDKAVDFLKKFLNDEAIVVKQSVEVALDMTDYFNSEQFNFLEEEKE